MKTCPICGRTANEKYCSECGALMVEANAEPVRETCYAQQQAPEVFVQEETAPAKRKGRKGAIARLVVAGLTLVITLVAAVMTMFTQDGLGDAVTGFFAVLGTGALVGAMILILCKWLGFILPKSFGWANRFWRSWHALTIFGLYLKGCVWVFILLIPVSVMTSLISTACFSVVMLLVNFGQNFFGSLLFLAISGCVLAVVMFLDLCKVKGLSPKAMLAQMKKSKAARSR